MVNACEKQYSHVCLFWVLLIIYVIGKGGVNYLKKQPESKIDTPKICYLIAF